MITNNRTPPNSLIKTLTVGLIVLLSITLATCSIDYCITNKPYEVIGLVGNESVTLTLGDYIRGYNLTFTSADEPIKARPSNPLNSVATDSLGFSEAYKIVNADVLESADKKWHQQGVVLAQRDAKSIGIVVTQFLGTRNIAPTKQPPQYYTLPSEATCFSASVIDLSSNVVIDCQTTDADSPQDLVCYIDTGKKSITHCLNLDSLDTAQDRKSQTLWLKNQVFLITGTYTRDRTASSMTYLTIYHVDSSKSLIDFVNIIDGHQLDLDYDIIISDFDVLKNGTILVHDMGKSQLLFVEYTLANEVQLLGKPWVYGSEGGEIEVTDVNTVLVATRTYVEEYDLTGGFRVTRYELERGDFEVVGLSANIYGIVVQTSRRNLYAYQRIMGTLNYLLGTIPVSNKDYLMSPYSNALYIFTDKEYEIFQLTSGSLRLNNFDQSRTITIQAHSTTSTCRFTLQVMKLESTERIVQKQDITKKHFTGENSQAISVNLEDIYSGKFLTYEAPKSTSEVKFTLDHVAEYEVTSGLKDSVMTQIVNLNKTAYLLLGISADNTANLEMCVTDDSVKKITCSLIYNSTLFAKDPILLTGRQRSSGQVVFVWTYSQGRNELLKYNTDDSFTKAYQMLGHAFDFSSVVIGEDRIFFVYKKFATIEALFDLKPTFETYNIDMTNFKPSTPDMVGFYPRELYLHPRSSELFYVKFPQHVCLMTFILTQPKTVDCTKVLQQMIPDQAWHVIIGTYTFVVFSPEGIKEYTILGNTGTQLHTVNLAFTWPVYYSTFLNTAVFETTDGRVVYYKLNKPLVDCLYYEVAPTNGIRDAAFDFSTEGAWTISTQNWKAYRQSYNTKLSIELIGDNKSFKEDVQFSIKVKGVTDETISTDNNITIVHYSTNITAADKTNDAISLPHQAFNHTIQLDIDKYLTGPRSTYNIICDYCPSNIIFQGAFKNKTENKEIMGADEILEVFDGHVVMLTNNRVNLVDSQGQLITYKVIEHVKYCYQMAWHAKIGLLVFCEDQTGQEVFGFDVNQENITQWKSTYPIHEEALITYADEIYISEIDANTFWVFVEDNDITDLHERINKKANVKVFVWTKDALDFRGILTSESFGIISVVELPIKDIDIINNKIIVATIGNVGIAYATLADKRDAPNVLMNPQVIPLRSIPQIDAYLLDDTIFQQVELLPSSSSTDLSILVTSSTSVAMVLEFTISENSTLEFKQIQQSFNRYGTLASVNWHAATESMLLLAYYDVKAGEEYIALYRRSNSTMVDFVEVVSVKILNSQLGEHTVYLTSQNVLFISDVGGYIADAKITRYDLSLQFNLLLSYTAPGNFNTITLSASNKYTSQNTEININFAHHDDDSSGVKWYTVMIIALIVLIVVGAAYGMYLKMIKNRKDKKVSLLTEGEEVDEVV